MTPLRLALFDCDGTLVDSQHLIVRAAEQAWSDLELAPPAAATIRQVVGLSLEDALTALAPDIGPARQRTLVERYRTHYTDLLLSGALSAPLFPGVLEALAALDSAQVLLGIATGKSRGGLDETLHTHGLSERFVTLQTADVARGKPAPDMVFRAAAETGVDVDSIIVIGDTVFDMEMAVAAKSAAIGVAWGYHDPDLLKAAGAAVIVRSFDEVPGAIQRLLA